MSSNKKATKEPKNASPVDALIEAADRVYQRNLPHIEASDIALHQGDPCDPDECGICAVLKLGAALKAAKKAR